MELKGGNFNKMEEKKISRFEDNKTYYVEVITKKYPVILEFGKKYEVLGKDIPTYCTEEDIKEITKEEFEMAIEETKKAEREKEQEFIKEIERRNEYTKEEFIPEQLHKPKFSLYHNGIRNTIPNGEIDIEKFLELIKEDNPTIEAIRECVDKGIRDKLKSELSYVTFSGTFEKRGNDKLKKSSGLVCLDYDDIEDLNKTKQELIKDKYTYCLFVSPSGKGLKLLVKIPEVKNNEEYGQYWSSISKHFKDAKVDEGTKDISRACYLSVDKNPYFNSESEIYTDKIKGSATNNKKNGNDKIEDYKPLILEISKKWNEGNRQELALSTAGYLRKEKRLGINKSKEIITEVCRICNDNELDMRLRAVDTTYAKDEKDIKGIKGFLEFNIKRETESEKKIELDLPSLEDMDKELTKEEEIKLLELKNNILSLLIDDKRPEAIEIAVQAIYQNHKFYAIRDDKTDEIWMYEKGIYVPHGASYVREFIRKVLAENYTAQFSNQVLDRVKVDNFIIKEKFFKNNYPNEMVVENGILNIHTKEITPYTSKKIFFTKLDFPYKPKAECPKIDKFFDDVLGEQKTTMYEFGGDCLQKSYKFKKLVVQEGIKDTAKTKTQGLITRFLGENNTSNIPLKRLTEDKYSLGELHNMLLNTCGEITEKFIGNIDNVKLLTGEDRISVMRKFLTDLKFFNYGKLMFACNNLPIINTDLAMWNRFIIFRYEREFIDKEEYNKLSTEDKENKGIKDVDILDKICSKEEFSGLLNRFLEGLERLEKKGYSNTKTGEQNKMYWIRKSDSLRAFCLDNIEEDIEGNINKKDFDKRYNRYCSKNKIKRLTKKHLRFVLETEYCVSDKRTSEGEYLWEGIKFREIKEEKAEEDIPIQKIL